MKRVLFSLITLVSIMTADAHADDPQVGHMVFFKLKENSAKSKQALVDACNKYLSKHDGVAYYSAGILADDLKREVNVRDFDVALHLVFKNKAAHDKYQTHPRHEQFIKENKDNWANVRVFDSYVQAGSETSSRLPDPVRGFSGMIRGKVTGKQDAHITLTVDEVVQVWSTSKAENPKKLLGQIVLVDARGNDGQPVASATRYVASLKVGETVSLDVRHAQGDVFSILDLTAEQRTRITVD